MLHYNLFRRHGSLRSELSVKTLFDAVEKWFQIKPEIFKQNPSEFKQKLLKLKYSNEMGLHQQRCETWQLDYWVFNKAVPETISADEKTLNFNMNQLLENPFNAANKGSSKLPVDADIS